MASDIEIAEQRTWAAYCSAKMLNNMASDIEIAEQPLIGTHLYPRSQDGAPLPPVYIGPPGQHINAVLAEADRSGVRALLFADRKLVRVAQRWYEILPAPRRRLQP